ncbi:hypothetical protein [Silvimonas sp.]|uniref:hypothetical protein n=1 Tax=Silvimonas sp. TaxID=2650811 RepID=UPI00284C1114|nr:hypothetical protein [Silvimonas sp.]MDR3426108.1 hypothetical protein [Silvimonas sp.]
MLNKHKWLIWDSLTVTQLAAVIQSTAVSDEDNPLTSNDERDLLRDELCDISDTLSSFGLQIPLILVVQCDSARYAAWHKIAGDQDWIRGAFCIQPFDKSRLAGTGIRDIDNWVRMLTDSDGTHASSYSLKSITDAEYAEHLRTQVAREKNLLAKSLAEAIIGAIVEPEPLTVSSPIGEGPIQSVVMRWVQNNVLATSQDHTSASANGNTHGEKE